MRNTTLCYIQNDKGQTLLLHRVKKENDLNKDKWIGVGGGFEDKESPEDCLLREVWEETGLTLTVCHREQFLSLLYIDGHRLLQQNILACLQSQLCVGKMVTVTGSNVNQFYIRILQQLLDGSIALAAQLVFRSGHTLGNLITSGNDLEQVLLLFQFALLHTPACTAKTYNT